MSKTASSQHPIHQLIAERWSPYGFADRTVAADELRSLFEAARWAPSSFNEQPWAYLVAVKQQREEFDKLLSCLVEPNQAWAGTAPVLALGLAGSTFTRNGKANRHALHDLGSATANLCLEATARGISVHQMAGIFPDRARELYEVPNDWEVVTGIAIGYRAEPDDLPDNMKKRELTPRTRKPLSDFVFSGKWGTAVTLASS